MYFPDEEIPKLYLVTPRDMMDSLNGPPATYGWWWTKVIFPRYTPYEEDNPIFRVRHIQGAWKICMYTEEDTDVLP